MKELTSGDVVKLEEGDNIEGEYMGYEESRQYPGSYAVRLATPSGNKVVFVSNIVIDKLETNNIKKGQKVGILFKGMVKSEKSGREYKDYLVQAE